MSRVEGKAKRAKAYLAGLEVAHCVTVDSLQHHHALCRMLTDTAALTKDHVSGKEWNQHSRSPSCMLVINTHISVHCIKSHVESS